jgi:hypothetical protein
MKVIVTGAAERLLIGAHSIHGINAFSALKIKEYRGASIQHSVWGERFSNQRIIR